MPARTGTGAQDERRQTAIPVGDSQEQRLRQRISSLEAQAAGLNLAQVMTRGFGGEIHYWSRGMERLYGFTTAEAIGRISHELLRTEFPSSLQRHRQRAAGTRGVDRRTAPPAARRQEIVVVSHQSLRRDAAGATPLVTEVNNDITEAWRGREALQYLASIVESSEDAIVGKTLDGVVTAWNAAAEAMFGYSAEEMIGQPITRLLPPDRVDEEAMILERLRRGERLRHYETVRVRKDGSEIAVALTVSPILDPSGAIIGASKIVRDITAERQSRSRIQEFQAELAHVARLTTMGQMASAIAHELNQPLTAVGNYASALGRLLAQPRTAIRIAHARSWADPPADRARRRGDPATARARRQAQHHATARGRQRVVTEAAELGLVGTRHRGVHTSIELDAAVGPAMLDRIQIGQVIVNLVRNAVEAMEASETRRIDHLDPRGARRGRDRVSPTPARASRRKWPSGCSSPSSPRRRPGSGLGLSICRELSRRMTER